MNSKKLTAHGPLSEEILIQVYIISCKNTFGVKKYGQVK